MNKILEDSQASIVAFCQKHSARRLSLFGFQVEGHSHLESDIDLLVEFDRGKEPGLLGLAEVEHELSTILGGRAVDLGTPNELIDLGIMNAMLRQRKRQFRLLDAAP